MLLRTRRRDSKKLALPSNSPNRFPKTKRRLASLEVAVFLFRACILSVRAWTRSRYDKTIVPFGVIYHKRAEDKVTLMLFRAICVCRIGFPILEDSYQIKLIRVVIH